MVIKGKYIYFFLSLELVNSETLYPLLINPKFKKLLTMIIINKVYFVIYWGQSASVKELVFCEEFLKLENLHSLIGLSIPLFAYLVTLNLKTLENVMRSLVLRDHNTKII